VITDLLLSRFALFASEIRKEKEGNSVRSGDKLLLDSLKVFGASDVKELISWYETNVVVYAEQMLQSERTLQERITEVEKERIRRQENLQNFISKHALPGTSLKLTHDAMVEAQVNYLFFFFFFFFG
jgi:hypothetical protein